MSNIASHKKTDTGNKVRSFTFGSPEPVLGKNLAQWLDVFEDSRYGYYEPPVSFSGLAKLRHANAYHTTIPYIKRNMIMKNWIPTPGISRRDMERLVFEFLIFANAFLQEAVNGFGAPVALQHIPSLNMRRMKEKGQYCQLQMNGEPIKFEPGEIHHLLEYDVEQEIYGVPDYFGGLHAILLNESATLFRRRYYDNGAHAGYIFLTKGEIDEEDEDVIIESLKNSKGVGNFRSMYLNMKGDEHDDVKILPVGDIATKDEFERIKNISRNDMLAVWRMHPALAAIMPENTVGFGDLDKIHAVYMENEIIPIQQKIMQLNDNLPPRLHLKFKNDLVIGE